MRRTTDAESGIMLGLAPHERHALGILGDLDGVTARFWIFCEIVIDKNKNLENKLR